MPDHSEIASKSPNRLIVLVPNQMLDEQNFAQQITTLSIEHTIPILLLDIIDSPNQQPSASIRLDNLTTLLTSISISAESRIIFISNWLVEFPKICRDNDLIVCLEEHTIQVRGGDHVPICEILPAVQNQPLLVLSSPYIETRIIQPSRRTELSWWIIALVILIIFSTIQYYLIQTTSGWVESLLIILSILIELAVFYLWNKIGFRKVKA
jgi:hypothetical protein